MYLVPSKAPYSVNRSHNILYNWKILLILSILVVLCLFY